VTGFKTVLRPVRKVSFRVVYKNKPGNVRNVKNCQDMGLYRGVGHYSHRYSWLFSLFHPKTHRYSLLKPHVNPIAQHETDRNGE